MSKIIISLAAGMAMIGGVAMSDTPKVAADISPVHSLVSRVMLGVGTPDLIVQAGASPHGYTLRPSEAKALQDAQVVFWMGESLSPWMEGALDTLSSDAIIITLLERDETILMEFREGALFEEHDDDDHGDEKHDDDGHGSYDPHAWLSPDNARIWLNLIASQLSIVDPENAGTYFANAAAARLEIEALTTEVNSLLEPIRGKKFIVFHDAYQYFEKAFDLSASGAISLGDASKPSPARIAEIQGRIQEESIDCVLSEPQFNKGLVATV
ncbi:MAG: zinc ABC transporter substrate-binding protein, partial [Paracoccaceae bacterium]|nr:zinc ABC transporter substrate-binding protein [Paracoccaceae bacterium]